MNTARRSLSGPLGMALLMVVTLGAAAHAGAQPDDTSKRAMRRWGIRLTSVVMSSSTAPSSDAEATRRSTHQQLVARQGRLNQCVAGMDLREDPVRGRSRSIDGRLTFSRSGRPTVRIDRQRGIASAAQGCVLETVRSVLVRPAPRGEVELRFRYSL